jgi:hypothetical protein
MLLQDRLGEILNQAFTGHVAAATLARASAGIELGRPTDDGELDMRRR